MKMGFLISHKNNERRRAILPENLAVVKNKDALFFEEGYGLSIGIEDEEYISAGVTMASREDILKCGILVDVKLGDADYLHLLDDGKILVGWAHAVQQIDFTSAVLNGGHTILAWEELDYRGKNLFYRNREVAGEAAVLHGFRYSNKMPYDAKVCILGNGQTAKGCLRILHGLGAKTVDVFPRKHEDLFREKMTEYDVVINCVMWDTNRTDRIIYRSDLCKFRKGTLIIDVSCDPYLEIETSHPTTIDDPVYEVDGVIHYAVDNTPAMFAGTVTKIISAVYKDFIDEIVTGKYSQTVIDSMVIEKGHILYENIRLFREKRGLFVK